MYKTFVRNFIIFIGLFAMLNFFLWNYCVEEVVTYAPKGNYFFGDISRLGYVRFTKTNIWDFPEFTKKHIKAKNYKGEKVDVLTIGDSFSNGIGKASYQDIIATNNNYNVLNIPVLRTGDFIEQVIEMNNGGYFDVIKPKYIILESILRTSMERYAKDDIDWNKVPTKEEMIQKYPILAYNQPHAHDYENNQLTPPKPDLFKVLFEKIQEKLNFKKFITAKPKKEVELDVATPTGSYHFINTGNFKYLYNLAKLHFNDEKLTLNDVVYLRKLKQPMFTSQRPDVIIYYKDDIDLLDDFVPEKMSRANDNLNKLADILAEKDIKLIVMTPPDKSLLYRPYLKEADFPVNPYYVYTRTLPKRYTFVDADVILSQALKDGVKDLYWAGDTHWTPNAIVALFDKKYNYFK
ncbi:MAG: hypothetical protein PHX18_06650 [Candidatus Gastranaerophilales bacterium]|nr:hypothetical protein [Candidatus Gastranaerophilales bacterium]